MNWLNVSAAFFDSEYEEVHVCGVMRELRFLHEIESRKHLTD